MDQVKDTIYTNQTGKFPTTSSRGHKYIMIMCEIDGNAVLVEPMNNKTEDAMVKTNQKMIDRLKTGGIFPKEHTLDSEISEKYKKAIEKNGMHWELVPVGMHQRNVAEKTTQTFKGHFKSILCGIATNLTLNKWDTLLPQAELTSNLLY